MSRDIRRAGWLVGTAAGLGLLGGTGLVVADQLNPGRVGSDATWVVHLDIERMVASPVVTHMLSHPERFDMEGLEQVKQDLGVDLTKDLKGVTLWGTGSPGEKETEESAVAVVSMTPKADELVAMLKKMSEPGTPGAASMDYNEITVKGYTVHSWKDKGDPRFGAVRPEAGGAGRTVVFGSDLGRVVKALETIDGKSPAVDAAGSAGLLSQKPGAGSILFVSVGDEGLANIGKNEPDNPASSIMRQASSAVLDIGDADGRVYAMVALHALDDKQAAQIAAVAQGILALGTLAAAEEPELKPLLEAIQGVQIKAEGARVRADAGWEHQEVINALEAAADHHGEMEELHEHLHDHHHGKDKDGAKESGKDSGSKKE